MSLRFIIGRAGVGKTRKCLDSVKQKIMAEPAGPPLIILVPEQASFQTEYALAASAEIQGFIRVQVLSFRRLAYRVLLEVGGGARAHIGEVGKRMVLRRMLEEHRDNLKAFKRVAAQPGFADTLASTLGELKTYCITPEVLYDALFSLQKHGQQALLTEKLEDIHLLYSEMENYLADRFTDPDDYLNLLAERLEYARSFEKAEVWVDGFTGFTPQEYQVLAALLRKVRRINVTLCADAAALGGGLSESDLFYPAWETYDTICEIAVKGRTKIEPPLLLEKEQSRFLNPAIAYLEENYFQRPARPVRIDVTDLLLAVAANRRAEVEGVAREIVALCRDKGYRYRDIVVLARDLDAYEHLITVVFADHRIPVFVDLKRQVMNHPLIELVRSALEVIVRNWAFEPVFRYLKTELAPLVRNEADLLENYVLAHGIRGSRWIDANPWDYREQFSFETDGGQTSQGEDEYLAEINRIRRVATSGLVDFWQVMRKSGSVREITEALFIFLSQLRVAEKLESWSLRAQAAGKLEIARRHSQVWNMLTELLDQVVETLGEKVLKPAEYAAVLDAGFDGMRLGLIPPGLDQVLAGSLDRSRSPSARACFIIGASENVLPARITGQGMLSEIERESLQVVGLQLSPSVHRQVFDEQHLVYIALTRAAEYLSLSFPAGDEEGGMVNMPSPIIARIRELLPGVTEKSWPIEPEHADQNELDFITSPNRCLSYLTVQLKNARSGHPISLLWLDVYNWYAERENWRLDCARSLGGLFYQNRAEQLLPRVAERLYGKPFQTSVSNIEKFRSCPFAHFLAKGLRLKERAVFKLSAPDLGQFFHAVLKLYGDRLRKLGLSWGEVDNENCRKIAGEAVDYLAPKLQSEILVSTARQRYLTGKIKRTVQRAVLVLSEHARRGNFRPVGLEVAFGPAGELPAVTFILPDGSEMFVTGRIDRVDAAYTPTGVYLRVIDYKSGRATINLSDIWHGLQLQLLTYLEVAVRYGMQLAGTGPGLPGAIFYFSLDDPLIQTNGESLSDEEVERRILKEMKMEGMLLADPAVVQMMDKGLTGTSDIIPVQFKKDGGFAARSAVLTPQQFNLLRAHLRRQLSDAGNDIVCGVIDIAPYRQGQFRSCKHCLYSEVCHFDQLIEGNAYRHIPSLNKELIWDKLAELQGGGLTE